MKKRCLVCFFVAVFVLFSLVVGCNSKTDTKELKKITLNEVAHSIFYAPMYIAIEEGYFAEEGIDLELVTGFGANFLVQFL